MVILFFVTIHILGEDGKNMYMLVVRSGLWALMVFKVVLFYMLMVSNKI